ncbi:HAD family hydrolase [Kitasatospora sp. NPDC052896]|uniref:HAD family hydrolase n=1 Tax=Kitasatospora sp. NPDC052896 TaxID=3364061 RepID=UPI0037C54F6F
MPLLVEPEIAVQRPPYLVFSDVDETLIACKSMFDFLRFQLTSRHGESGEDRYLEMVGELRAMAAAGAPREEVNRSYYRLYAGEEVAEIAELGRRWFAERSATPGFFIGSTVAALREHRAAGAELVLVSGSFDACVAPIAGHVGASYVLATAPEAVDGRYTGEVVEPMIGYGKRAGVMRLLADHAAVDPRDCFAYGDHLSDLPMLECVGHPRVVGGDPELIRRLDRRAGVEPGCAVACWSMGAGQPGVEPCPRECVL